MAKPLEPTPPKLELRESSDVKQVSIPSGISFSALLQPILHRRRNGAEDNLKSDTDKTDTGSPAVA